MSADTYLLSLLAKYAVNATGAKAAYAHLAPVVDRWANTYLVSAQFSGSLAKGTGISLSTDADVFLSVSSTMPDSLADMYGSLFNAVTAAGYTARKQDVSIGVSVDGYSIDLVPGRRQSQFGGTHSLYRNRTGGWTLTDVNRHIAHVIKGGRVDEIRVLKLWRLRNGLTFPSFYLELAVMDALLGARHGEIAINVWNTLKHVRDRIQSARYVDPANTGNIVSDDCTAAEKAAIAASAAIALTKKNWGDVVW